MKIKHKKSGDERIVSKERWDAIAANGFAAEFEILEKAPVPDEVAERIKLEPSETVTSTYAINPKVKAKN